jgi:hypothetical protein
MASSIRYLWVFGGVVLAAILLLVGFNALSAALIARAP